MTQGKAAQLRDLSGREEQRRLSKEELLRPRVFERTEFIEGLGGEIVIRSLTHRQQREIREKAGFGTPDYDEEKLTSFGILESIIDPKLEEKDLERLQDQDAGVYDEIVLKISLLNMMGHSEELKKDSSEIPS